MNIPVIDFNICTKNDLSLKQWNQKGEELLAAGRYQEAIECFDKAIRLDHDFADAWRNMGFCFDISKRHNEAATCFADRGCSGPFAFRRLWSASYASAIFAFWPY